VAEIVKNTVPNSEVTFAPGAEPDKRNYRVDFSKFNCCFPEYRPQWNVPRGVREVYEFYKRSGLQRDMYEGPQYKRIAQIQLY